MTDQIDFQEIKTRALNLQAHYSQRQTMFDAMDEIYFLELQDQGKLKKMSDDVKLTLSPDGRNSVMGAIRLLTAADPVINIPKEANTDKVSENSEEWERFAKRMWNAAGKIAGIPIHYDAVLSALLYGEVHIAITSMQDLLSYDQKRSPARAARTKANLKRTPFLFEVWNPRECFAEFDRQGLCAHYRRVETTFGRVQDDWGEEKTASISKKRTDSVVLCEWWDLDYHVVWIEGVDSPIISEKHELPCIPIVAQLTEGSRNMFSKVEQQNQPFLYTLWKSDLWNRQNLMLTVLYTLVFGIGASPMFLYKTNTPGKQLNLDFSKVAGIATIDNDEDLSPMLKQVIDPTFWQGMDIANQKGIESTIYRQTLGEPLGKNAPYSMVALLNQAGRLPLISPQRRLGWAVGRAIETAFKLMKKEGGGKRRAQYGQDIIEIEIGKVPEDVEFEAQIEISLPTDQLQEANTALRLTEGDNPLVSNAWVLENILHIGQPDQMRQEVWRERASQLRAMNYFADQLLLAQQKLRAAQQGGMPPVPGGAQGGGGGQQPMQGIPPEMLQGGQQGPEPPQGMPPQEMPPSNAPPAAAGV